MKAFTIKISKEQIIKMNKASNRQASIDAKIPNFSHKVHKTKKDYNSQTSKIVMFD